MPRAKSVPLCALDPSTCSPTSEHGQFSSPKAPTPVRCSTSWGGGGRGRMQKPGIPESGQPPHPPTSSGHRLGRDWGHQVSTGMHHREQCPAEASFPDPAEKEPPPPRICPCLRNCLCASHTHTLTYTRRRTDPLRHTRWCEPLLTRAPHAQASVPSPFSHEAA